MYFYCNRELYPYFYTTGYWNKLITAPSLIIKPVSVLPGCLPEDSAVSYRQSLYLQQQQQKRRSQQLLERSTPEISRPRLTDQALELKNNIT